MTWTLASALALGLAWLASIGGHAPPLALSRALLAAAALAASVEGARALRRRFAATRDSPMAAMAPMTPMAPIGRMAPMAPMAPTAPTTPTTRRLLLGSIALLALAFALRYAGLDHEIGGRYYQDEGTYLQHATKINAGEPVVDSFVYPHFLYYAGAFAIWIASLVETPLRAFVVLLWPDVTDWATLCRFALRHVVAFLGALVVLPTIALGARIGRGGGRPESAALAGLLGGALVALSPLWDEGAHLGICDVPSAFFATLCLAFCARWLDDSRPRVWLAAGAAAGLAAGSKYPAGLVAIAIVAVALRDLLGRERSRLGLPIAGGAALASFLLVNPSLLLLPGAAFFGNHSVFFGAIQYSSEGWLGVSPSSRVAWYGAKLAESFGWLAAALGLGGWMFAPSAARARLAWLLPFPVAFLALLASLPLAVERNLYPVTPFLAAFAGIGLGALVEMARDRSAVARRVAAGAVTLALAWPAAASLAQAVSYVRPSTRDLAVEWLGRELPRGLTVMTENYGPNIPRPEFIVRKPPGRFLAMLAPEEAASWGVDVVVLASPSWGRFFQPGVELDDGERSLRASYERYRSEGDLLARFESGRFRRGPDLEVRTLPAGLRRLELPHRFAAAELVVPDSRMRRGEDLVATVDGEWVAVVLPLEAGSYRVAWSGEVPSGGAPSVEALRGTEVSVVAEPDGARIDVPRSDTLVLRIVLRAGDRISSVSIDREDPGGSSPSGSPTR